MITTVLRAMITITTAKTITIDLQKTLKRDKLNLLFPSRLISSTVVSVMLEYVVTSSPVLPKESLGGTPVKIP